MEKHATRLPCCRSHKLRALVAAAGTLLVILALSTATALSIPNRGDQAPALRLPDRQGKQVSLPAAGAGKILIIHFWATNCDYCLKEIAALEKLRREESGSRLFPVSISVKDTRAGIDDYLGETRPGYPILLDENGAVAGLYGVTGIPTTFIIDGKGIIRFKIFGEISAAGLRRLLSTLVEPVRAAPSHRQK